MTVTAYREPGLSRQARDLWARDIAPATAQPPRPSARRCGKCGYRQDAPGHYVTCGRPG